MRRRTWILLGGAAVAAVLLGWGLWPRAIPDPIVRGKLLSAWLDERKPGTILADEAAEAVRALGPAAVPTLLAWLESRDPALVRGWREVDPRAFVPIGLMTGSGERFRARTRAMLGFHALGPAGRSAWPVIADLACRSPDEPQRMDAINSLSTADAGAAPPLAAATTDPDREVRLRAIFAIKCLHLDAEAVSYPALERLRADPDPAVRAEAAQAIASMDSWIGGAGAGLKEPKPGRRSSVARIIGEHGAHARALLPELEAAAGDPDPSVRRAVAEAIRRVGGPAASPMPAQAIGGAGDGEKGAPADRPARP